MHKILLTTLILVSCSSTKSDPPSNPPPSSAEASARSKPRDAAPSDSTPVVDANLGPTPGLVTCYAGATFPNQECSIAAQYCCWAVYVPPPTGSCQAIGTGCTHNQEYCDGQEDCPTGQLCYAHNIFDGDMWHWELRCAPSPIDPADKIMCRLGGTDCPSGQTCVQASSAGVYDMMPTQYMCH